MAKSQDSEFLARAAELAVGGRFRVEPNPLVGCVLVKGGRVVGEGFHAYWGGPHAEVAALKAAGETARGATAYVTLEPCGHTGKTLPCSGALVRAGVKAVVYAHPDPNPETAGQGLEALREAGVEVRRVRGPAAAASLLERYVAHLEQARPWVIGKWAMTLDGRIASRRNDSKWITDVAARKWTHRHFRARCDAIVVGAGTVRADDPQLTNRSGRGVQPLRVVVCGRRSLPPKAKVLRDGNATLLAVPAHFRAPAGADVVACGRAGRVEIPRLMQKLHGLGIRRILVEGGGDLLGSFFDKRRVDQVVVVVAPRILGGVSAVSPVEGRGQGRIAEAWELDHVMRHALGPDEAFEGYVR